MAYGACKSKDARHPDRISYVINAKGKIQKAYKSVNARTHFDDVLRDIGGDAPEPEKKGLLRRLFGG